MVAGVAYPAVECQQDRVALDVPVDDTLRVQVSQRLQHSLAHSGDLLLVQPGWGTGVTVVAGLQG